MVLSFKQDLFLLNKDDVMEKKLVLFVVSFKLKFDKTSFNLWSEYNV